MNKTMHNNALLCWAQSLQKCARQALGLRALAMAAVLALLTLLPPALAAARPGAAGLTITVNRTDDPAPRLVEETCNGMANDCSLREAVAKANANPDSTINLPAATYELTIPAGATEGYVGASYVFDNAMGDLDVTAGGTSIAGTGAAGTTIRQTTPHDRIFELNPSFADSFTFSISGVTLQGGRETTGVGGAGIFGGGGAGSQTTVTDCAFRDNQSSGVGVGGGALFLQGGSLTVTGTTFDGNSSTGPGGGLFWDPCNSPSGGTLSISSSTFLTNTSGADGGALFLTEDTPLTGQTANIAGCTFQGNRTTNAGGSGGALYMTGHLLQVNITTSTFAGNRVGTAISDSAASGGAIANNLGTLAVHYCRFSGNAASAANRGNAVYNGDNMQLPGPLNTTANADNNWWGHNSGPAAGDLVTAGAGDTLVAAKWLQLRINAAPGTINAGQQSTLTAGFLTNSADETVSAGNLGALIGLPVTFDNALLGTLSDAQSTIQAAGTATATFTAGSWVGIGHADATVDSATATATIVIARPPTVTQQPVSQVACAGSSVSFFAAADGYPAPTVQWQVSTDGGSAWDDIGGATAITYTHSALASEDGYQYRAVFTNAGGSDTTSAATLTANIAPGITANPTNQAFFEGGTVTFTAAAFGKPAPTVQWQLSTDGGATWDDIPRATETTYSLVASAADVGHRYRAAFTNSCGTATSTSAELTQGYRYILVLIMR